MTSQRRSEDISNSRIIPQPDKNLRSLAVDGSHLPDLMVAFKYILLLNAESIDPEPRVTSVQTLPFEACCCSDVMQEVVQVPSDPEIAISCSNPIFDPNIVRVSA